MTYSLLAGCVGLLVFGFWVERRKEGRFARVARYAVVLQLLAVVSAYFVLRPGRGRDPRPELAAAKRARAPVFLDFYSNY